MQKHCVPLAALPVKDPFWNVKVAVIEKTTIRRTARRNTRYVKLVIADEDHTKMQCIIYEHEIDRMNDLLQLYQTYYIGHSEIRELNQAWSPLVDSQYELLINRSSYVRRVPQESQLSLENMYDISAFRRCYEFTDVVANRINILGSVINVLETHTTSEGRRLQEFAIVNQERMPMRLTLWEEHLESEAPYLVEHVHQLPIILATRLSVNTFKGISVGTTGSTTILYNPPISQTTELQQWLGDNKDYIKEAISQRLHEKERQFIQRPMTTQIKKLTHITNAQQQVKSFWAAAVAQITDPEQPLYVMICPECRRKCGAFYKCDFSCLYCNREFQSPLPKLRFRITLSDETDSILAMIEEKEAEMLLGLTAEDIIESEEKEGIFDAQAMNTTLQALQSLYHVKAYQYPSRVGLSTQYTVISRLPTSPEPLLLEEPESSSKKRKAIDSPDHNTSGQSKSAKT